MDTRATIDRMEYNERVDFLLDVIERKSNDVDMWKSAWDASSRRCSALEDKVQELERESHDLLGTVDDLNDQIDNLNARIDELEGAGWGDGEDG